MTKTPMTVQNGEKRVDPLKKPPRATLRQKIDVLDYIAGPPVKSQIDALNYFRKQGLFSISQATLSNWTTHERELREEFEKNPNLKYYKKKPVLKYPQVTVQVEKHISELIASGQVITDNVIRDTYKRFMNKSGDSKEKDFKLSAGMLKSFKKRNSVLMLEHRAMGNDTTNEIRSGSSKDKGDGDGHAKVINKNRKAQLGAYQTGMASEKNEDGISNSAIQGRNANVPQDPVPRPSMAMEMVNANPAITNHVGSTPYSLNSTPSNLDFNFDDIFNNNTVGFNTRLIHSDDIYSFFPMHDTTINPLMYNNNNSASNNNFNSNGTDYVQKPPDLPLSPLMSSNANLNISVASAAQKSAEKEQSVDLGSKRKLPFYPKYQNPLNDSSEYKRHKQTVSKSLSSKISNPNSEKIEKILENITYGHVTLYNSGTSAIMGILSFINPSTVYIHEKGYKGTHDVIKLLNKLTGVKKFSLDHLIKLRCDEVPANSVIILESPMNPLGYVHDLSFYSSIAKACRSCQLIVDSTLAPPPLQFPFKQGADYIVYSAVKYLAGVSDLGAGFIVSKTVDSKTDLHLERSSLGTSIANFDSFLLVRSLRTYKMRILTQCNNTEKIIKFFKKNFSKYEKIVDKIHHASLQSNKDIVMEQLNGYYNPVFALELKHEIYTEKLLGEFNFLSNNPNLEGGETLVELVDGNSNFSRELTDGKIGSQRLSALSDLNYKKMLRFSVGCEDFQDIIRDIDQAMMSLIHDL